MKFLEAQRKQLRPKKVQASVETFLESLKKKLPQTQVFTGGSHAKGTSIRGSHDIDVFVIFPHDTKNISERLAKALPRAKRLKGSRDYFQIKKKGHVLEIVPVLMIKDWRDAQNVTDMSPLHVAYVKNHLSEKQKDDVRLAKQFCKAQGIYGAESYTKGFSGYVLELLIMHYKSFEKLLAASRKWKPPVVINLEHHYHTHTAALLRLNDAKKLSPLIIIDPLQPERNAAAALSLQSFEAFQKTAVLFLKKPSSEFFDLRINQKKIKREWKKYSVLFVTAKTPKGKQDVVGCKMLAKHENAIKLFEQNEFSLVHADWRFGENKTIAWYVLKNTRMPKLIEQTGPPKDMSGASIAFKTKHNKAYLRQQRWYAKIKRKFTNANTILKAAWYS